MPDDDGAPPAAAPDGVGAPDAGAAPVTAQPFDEPPLDEAPAEVVDADPGAPADPTEVVLVGRLAGLEAAVTALAHRYDSESARAEARERVIERQHSDIERLRTDERFGVLQPVLVDLCALRNDLLRQATKMPPDQSVERMATLLVSFAASVEDTLLRYGVEPQPRAVGVPFAPRQQRVARVVDTDDPQRDGTVAEIVQDGYAEVDGGRVVVPTRVAVHRTVQVTAQDTNATKEHVDA